MGGHAVRRALFSLMLLGLALAACQAVIGIDDYQERMDAGADAHAPAADVVGADANALESGADGGSDGDAEGG